MSSNVQGTHLPASDAELGPLTDWAKVRKYYKLNGISRLDKMSDAEKRAEGEVLVLGGMALRGV